MTHQDTKTKIIEAGAQIIHLKGFNNTGIQEILDASGVPKGSFYFYFKSKEDFGLQVIDHFVEGFMSVADEILNNNSLPPLQRLKNFSRWFIDFFKSQNCTCGCPIGNISQEMADINPKFREKLNGIITLMANCYIKPLKEAQAAGEISVTLDVEETSRFIISCWHGALMHMKVVKSLEPLETCHKFIFERVLKV